MGCFPHVDFATHSRKPVADGWPNQVGGDAICPQALSVARRIAFTVSNNSLM
jgi:hypothetical protein